MWTQYVVTLNFLLFFISTEGVQNNDRDVTRQFIRNEKLPFELAFAQQSKGRLEEFGKCPPGATGQFHYPADCKRFLNCWKGRGTLQVCSPGTLFNPETRECDHPNKVRCMDEDGYQSEQGQVPMPMGYVRFPGERPGIAPNQRSKYRNGKQRQEESDSEEVENSNERRYTGRPPYYGESHLNRPTRKPDPAKPKHQEEAVCERGATGHFPHPSDCHKFLHCWDGRTFIKECGPGTAFNPAISVCDHIHNVKSCGSDQQRGSSGSSFDPDDSVQIIPDDYRRSLENQTKRRPTNDNAITNEDSKKSSKIPQKGGKTPWKGPQKGPQRGKPEESEEEDNYNPQANQPRPSAKVPEGTQKQPQPETNQNPPYGQKIPQRRPKIKFDSYGNPIAVEYIPPNQLEIPNPNRYPQFPDFSDPYFNPNYKPLPNPNNQQYPQIPGPFPNPGPQNAYYNNPGYILSQIPLPPPPNPHYGPQNQPFQPKPPPSKNPQPPSSPQNGSNQSPGSPNSYPQYNPNGQPQNPPFGQTQNPHYHATGQPIHPQYNPIGQPQNPHYHPTGQPINPQYNPIGQPQNPQFNPAGQPLNSQYNPIGQPQTPQFNPAGQPVSPIYYPTGQSQNPQFNPSGQPQNPQFNPSSQQQYPQFNPSGQPQSPQYNPTGQNQSPSYNLNGSPQNSNPYQNPNQQPNYNPNPPPQHNQYPTNSNPGNSNYPSRAPQFNPNQSSPTNNKNPGYPSTQNPNPLSSYPQNPIQPSVGDPYNQQGPASRPSNIPQNKPTPFDPTSRYPPKPNTSKNQPNQNPNNGADTQWPDPFKNEYQPDDQYGSPDKQPYPVYERPPTTPQTIPNVDPNRDDYNFPEVDEYLGQENVDIPEDGQFYEEEPKPSKPSKSPPKKYPSKSQPSGLAARTMPFDISRATTTTTEMPEEKPSPPSGQNLRLRGGSSVVDGYLEIRDPDGKWGLACDDSNAWDVEEASVICRELGFNRGAEFSWQGYPMKPGAEKTPVSVEKIVCSGEGTFETACNVSYAKKSKCKIAQQAVGIRCYHNMASTCQPREVHLGSHCYSLDYSNDTKGRTLFEASEKCFENGGHLLDLNTQPENDFISEWLLRSHPNVTSVMTAGVGVTFMGMPMWVWQGTDAPMLFQKWWTGWSGERPIPQGRMHQPVCLVMKRKFPCPNKTDEEREELDESADLMKQGGKDCITDYFFWDVEPCENLKTQKLPFVCERPMSDIGCVEGRGESYTGPANTTASGKPCLPWDHPKVIEGLARRYVQERSAKLTGHNYCRNVGKPDRHPWCFVEGSENSEYCDIPHCYATGTSEALDE